MRYLCKVNKTNTQKLKDMKSVKMYKDSDGTYTALIKVWNGDKYVMQTKFFANETKAKQWAAKVLR